MPKKTSSLRAYAARYHVSHEFIRKVKAEGIDLEDADAVAARLDQDRAGLSEIPRALPTTTFGSGLSSAIERLKATERALHDDYLAALKAGSKTAGVRLKEWAAVVEQLRKVEADNPSIEREKQNAVSKDELASVLGVLFGNLRQDLDSLARRLSTELEAKTVFEIEPAIKRETDRIVDALYACKYLTEGAVNG